VFYFFGVERQQKRRSFLSFPFPFFFFFVWEGVGWVCGVGTLLGPEGSSPVLWGGVSCVAGLVVVGRGWCLRTV
jgi:hypothetical protein